jgi:hypothetical protein
MVTPRVTEIPGPPHSQRELVIASLLAMKSESGKPGTRRP